MKTFKALGRKFGLLALSLLVLALMLPASAAHGTAPGAPAGPAPADGVVAPGDAPQGGGAVAGGPGHVVLNGFDFKPFNQTVGYQYSAMVLENPSASAANYYASAHLPQGATLTQVVVYFLDNNSTSGMDVDVALLLANDFSTTAATMAVVSSSSVPAGAVVHYAVTTAITSPVVDNAANNYLVQVNLPNSANVGLVAVRIDYDYPVLLPLVLK